MDAERIKKIRLSLGWSQERLARELGVSFSTVNRWERGRTSPSPMAIKGIKKLDMVNASNVKGNRKSLRLKANCPVDVRLLGQNTPSSSSYQKPVTFGAVTENLSSSGLMFKTVENVSHGKRLSIGWNFGDKHLETVSEVVWIKGVGPEKQIGVRFDNPMPEVISNVINAIVKG
ncbi:MAG: helix-turn-helix domain-containing protein [Thermodesulfobacteriota bacterium]